MLERFILPKHHAIAVLMEDHDAVKKLFDEFEKTDSAARKEKIIHEALQELKMHAVIEDEIFYPAVRKQVETDIMNEADEEHHVARILIAELDKPNGGGDHRHAKFIVLAENVRHHIKEEEGEMLPQAKDVEIDFEMLGQQMLARKEELKKHGIPADREHAMVSAAPRATTASPKRATAANGKKPAAAQKSHGPRARKTH
jgi:hemerythrin-like domain-containing protein